MSRILTVSIASVVCRPFEVNSVQAKKTGLAFITQQQNLAELEVVVFSSASTGFLPGDKALVRADRFTQPWAKERLRAEGIEGEFILVPLSEIILKVCKD